MPRWLLIVLGLIAVVWLISDPLGFAGMIKDLIGSVITFARELTS